MTRRGLFSDPKDDTAWRWVAFGDGSWEKLPAPPSRQPQPERQGRWCQLNPAVVSPDRTFSASADHFDVNVCRAAKDALLFSLRPAAGLDAALVSAPNGLWEVIGPDAREAEKELRCRVSVWSLPFELCRERFLVPHLAERVLRGESTVAEP